MNKKQLLKTVYAIFDSVLRKDLRNKSLKKNIIDLRTKKRFVNDNLQPVLLTSPLYGSDDSYSSYINQNSNNEMFQHVMYNKPRLIVKNTQDFYNKYFQNDNFTFK